MAFVPVAVIEKPSQQRGKPIVQYRLPNTNDLVLEFAHKRSNKDGSAVYTCTQCRSIEDHRRSNNLASVGKPAMVKVENGMFVEDPENPVRNAHICAPKNLGFADARRELIGLCAKLHDDVDHRTPQQLRHALSESVDKPEHSNLDVTERFEYLDYMKNGPNGKSDTIRRALQRNKSRFDPMMLGALPNPLFNDLSDHECLKVLDDGTFLLIASRRLLQCVFDNNNNLQTRMLLCDGRYSQIPKELKKNRSTVLYSMHAEVKDGHCLPIFVGVLPDSTTASYEVFFGKFIELLGALQLLPALQTISIMTDFEQAAMCAIESKIGIRLRGCYQHFKAAIRDNAKKHGIEELASRNTDVATFLRRISMIPFLPQTMHGYSGFLNIPSVIQVPNVADRDKLYRFRDYFDRTWVTGGQYSRFLRHWGNFGPRTTNFVEGWHNAIGTYFTTVAAPTMIDFVGYMRTELSNAKVDARALILGTKQPRYIAPSEAERQRKVLDLLQQFYNLWNNSVLMPPIPDIEAYADRLAYLLGAAP